MGAVCARDTLDTPPEKATDAFASRESVGEAAKSSSSTAPRPTSCCPGPDGEDAWLSACSVSYATAEVPSESGPKCVRVVTPSSSLDVEVKGRPKKTTTKRRLSTRRSVYQGGTVELADFVVYQAREEELRWFTVGVEQMWKPFIEKAIKKLLLEDLTRSIQENAEGIYNPMKKFAFTACNFGDTNPQFGPLKVRAKDDLVELLIDMDWKATGSLIEVSFGSLALGMKDLELHGPILLVFSPLLEILPITGAMSITFPDPPMLSWTWTGMGKALAVLDNIKESVVTAIFEALVVPSRIFIEIADFETDVDKGGQGSKTPKIEDYRSPVPLGVMHISVLEARNLPSADFNGSSDPYVRVRVGQNKYETCGRSATLNPVWGKPHNSDFLVYHMEQHVFVEVYDADFVSQADLLGTVCVNDARTGGKKRPTVHEMLIQPDGWWELEMPAGLKHDERNSIRRDAKILLRCELRMVEDEDIVRPIPVNCEKLHGLQVPVGGKTKTLIRVCSLCGKKIAKSWGQALCNASAFDPGMECASCNFRCCSSCLTNKRPAAALLRICFKSGVLPVEDAYDDKSGVYLAVRMGAETLWSCCSRRPAAEANDEQVQTVLNLSTEAKLHPQLIAKCVGIPTKQVVEILDAKSEERVRRGDKQLGHRALVIWNYALHFLVRNPGPNMTAVLMYQSATAKFEKEVPLRSAKKHSRDSRIEDRMSRYFEEITWELRDEKNPQRRADIVAEISLDPLTDAGLR
eukprot:TRINITY_DN14108_c0_g1_i1.p1 TRINITY_DN14108_c0_g1~~TRINITY_DN14108_c0_g1_i1.p1  ORF type:complete len:746 (-),score=111.98 TRINITY_DN14108_c0_g1_i1:83-2320(-)